MLCHAEAMWHLVAQHVRRLLRRRRSCHWWPAVLVVIEKQYMQTIEIGAYSLLLRINLRQGLWCLLNCCHFVCVLSVWHIAFCSVCCIDFYFSNNTAVALRFSLTISNIRFKDTSSDALGRMHLRVCLLKQYCDVLVVSTKEPFNMPCLCIQSAVIIVLCRPHK